MKILGRALLGLGAFLLVAGVLAATWATGAVKKTPTDVNQTTYLSGEASKLGAPAKPIYAISVDQVDSDHSDNNTDLWTRTVCVMFGTDASAGCGQANDPNTLSLPDPMVYASDRVSGLAADSPQLPDGTPPTAGLVNKFPFDSKRQDYPYWDDTMKADVQAVYVDTEKIQGVTVYKYTVSVDKAPITIAKGINGLYTNDTDLFVEPKTGAIIDQHEHVQQFLDDGTEAVDLNLAFTPDQVADFVSDAKHNTAQLALMTSIIPIVGIAGGIVCLLAGGGVLLLQRRRSTPPPSPKKAEPAMAGV